MSYSKQNKTGVELNRLYEEDSPVHDWYRFVLSYPPHLVRNYLVDFGLNKSHTVLDPFSGTGTTLVECKKLGINSIGIEANQIAHLASKVKTNWSINEDKLLELSKTIAEEAEHILQNYNAEYKTLTEDQGKLIINNSISQIPLHKTLVLLEIIMKYKDNELTDHLLISLAKQIVFSYSNLKFGPEVGVSRVKKTDADVVGLWFEQIKTMVRDIKQFKGMSAVKSEVILGDARNINTLIQNESVDAIITSPPYPNEKDYSRTTRLESVILGFIKDKSDLRRNKERLLRSNTRNVYVSDNDEIWIENNILVRDLSREIENKRIELGKTSGFEKYYHRVVELYFGGIAKHLESMKPILRPGARLAYVVGDQASYFRIHIKTGEIIADIASTLGYKVDRIDLFRTRLSTVTKDNLREEVVILTWMG
ncbi:DNA methyltransferase [Paenibacillus sp. L3-i20]|uniref:DNA methyltransferase n=1 Tax=Paenibacillus sp. L3-i20 TaxID=2905833 RepID=UPI001EDD92A5|nr:DNA methyltransferase [Paenibacillus sp. L3-i20]GKU80510.1 DNA modification methyltransferase [Paenibacillus sp. L3-i20]